MMRRQSLRCVAARQGVPDPAEEMNMSNKTGGTPKKPGALREPARIDSPPALRFEPLTPKRWADFEKLFGEKGACGGCWCMWPRLPSRAFSDGKGASNKAAMKQVVASGAVAPGILAYAGGEPIGWCAVAPRVEYVRLATSRVLKPLDDQPVWSVPCFFVAKSWRRRGVTVQLLEAAVAFAQSHGAKIVEGYPVEPYTKKMPDAFAWVGLPQTFRKAKFSEAGRRSKSRPIMRRASDGTAAGGAAPRKSAKGVAPESGVAKELLMSPRRR